ncbi:MAG: 5-(carboxyamino)imidazole ribonucleotide mutase [Candidatus Aminicenantes bacterium]|nr:5-(carboxyamino)imidazole ribonucleotide mutase [Candidatus Aminicenantes bacterium]
MKVAFFIGSESDLEIVQEALSIFKEFEVPFSLEVTSAHRSPERTKRLILESEEQGAEVFICAAGKAAHLAGVVASHTAYPVIGVPIGGSDLDGLDALLSTVQMPRGVPVACMGIGKHGAINAALLAVQILSLKDESLRDKYGQYKTRMAEAIEGSSRKVKVHL